MNAEDDQQGVAAETTIKSVLRALDVLAHFGETDQRTLGVTEIARALGLSKTIVYRVLNTLRARDFIEVDRGTRRYTLGPRVLTLAEAYRRQSDVRVLARAELEGLVQRTNETATVSIRVGCSRMYIDQVTPERDVKMVVQIGQHYPLHAGSSSKAFLAFLSAEDAARCLDGELAPLTSSTRTSRADLERDLDEVRRRGYASSFGERDPGAASIAAPIRAHGSNEPVAVLSVCGPIERFRDEVDTLVPHLAEAATRLSQRLGYQVADDVARLRGRGVTAPRSPSEPPGT